MSINQSLNLQTSSKQKKIGIKSKLQILTISQMKPIKFIFFVQEIC